MSENIVTLNSESFDKVIQDSTKPVLVDFWAPWCGPCKHLTPILEEVSSEMAEQVMIGKVNIDDNSDLATKFGIMSIPTMLIFKEGKQVESIVGLRNKDEIKEKLSSVI